MKRKQAFTLIELLVVVLIIGILSAIALPQYEKAVEKSKAAQALTMLKSAYQAAVVYYMANGGYPASFEDMGFDIPWTGNKKWAVLDSVIATKSSEDWSLQLYQNSVGALVIYIGLLSGDYRGGGFGVEVVNRDGGITPFKAYCAERTSNGTTFKAKRQEGDYCYKIMNTPKEPSWTGSYRKYDMP